MSSSLTATSQCAEIEDPSSLVPDHRVPDLMRIIHEKNTN